MRKQGLTMVGQARSQFGAFDQNSDLPAMVAYGREL